MAHPRGSVKGFNKPSGLFQVEPGEAWRYPIARPVAPWLAMRQPVVTFRGAAPLKVGIVSDIHCNLSGLDLALEAMGDVDELLCLGDSIFEYQFSNDVVARLRERRAHIIQGNHEEVFLSPAGTRARERVGIDPALLQYVAKQPHRRYLELAGKRLLLIHSTPWEPRGEYVHPHSAKLDRFAEADADIVLYGHTHCQTVKRIGSVLVINPGSAGDPRDSRNDRQLSCAVLDMASDEVQVINYPDPRYTSV
jgi:putative phosphoesterase